MTLKEIFYQEKENCNEMFSHITDNVHPQLKEIDDVYGAADVLSMEYAQKHKDNLKYLSAIGTIITIAFLLYDEAELHGLILICIIFILLLFILNRRANNNNCLKKYLEYRVLAETLRVQYFLLLAGIDRQVTDILPWFIQKSIPWIKEVLLSLPTVPVKDKESVLDCWILNQKKYHEGALKNAEDKKHKNDQITNVVIIITIIAYVAALIFEIYIYTQAPTNINVHVIRAILKIVLGTMSAITLFTGSYYGKMSLGNIILDHQRMIDLYKKAEDDISINGEDELELRQLAHEFLIENSAWYAYQSMNKVDLVL